MENSDKKSDIRDMVNERHTQIYNKLLDNIEYLLDEFSRGIVNSDYEPTDIPKTTIATLEFLVSSIVKIQKGHRTALGLDNESDTVIEPQISVIEGADFKKL